MKELDEQAIIGLFQSKMGSSNDWVAEDVEVGRFGRTKIVAKTDTLVESTDIPPSMKLEEAARKSVVACVSDFAAKGVKPKYGIISVNLPASVSRSDITEIATGFKKACVEYGITILGGDTNQGQEIVFNVCIFGTADGIVTRRGAKKDDAIFVTGPFGYTAAGLDILLNNKKIAKTAFVKKAIRSVMRPKPQLGFGIKNKRYFSASMDSSDGLSTTLTEMAKQSKSKFVINDIPSKKDLEDFAQSQNIEPDKLVFHGGEEYEFVFTVPQRYKGIVKKNARASKTPIMEIGYVAAGKGVFMYKDKDGMIPLKDLGWRHFR